MFDSREAALRLSLTPGIGPRTLRKLLDAFGGPEAALTASGGEWRRLAGVPPELLAEARGIRVERRIEKVRRDCERLGLSRLALGEPDYPAALAAIHDPPAVLYIAGRLPDGNALARSVAIVGTRKASDHGLAFSYRIASDLTRAGVTIVSGLARGIDAEAHRAVADSSGCAVAVLPRGLDAIHPPANRPLARRLLAGGCLLSEQPPGTGVQRGHFAGRNRIISGLSRAVIVIEAGERSGALLTAEFAIEQGRSVFVMPGRPGDHRVAGSLALLREGASVLLDAGDVAAELGLPLAPPDRSLPELGAAGPLLAGGNATFDALLSASGLGPAELLARLGRLELAGKLRRGHDGRYYPSGP
jgi:DNA processing protein